MNLAVAVVVAAVDAATAAVFDDLLLSIHLPQYIRQTYQCDRMIIFT